MIISAFPSLSPKSRLDGTIQSFRRPITRVLGHKLALDGELEDGLAEFSDGVGGGGDGGEVVFDDGQSTTKALRPMYRSV